MAKVKITGHASGSGVLTITAPNTSTDRTITLPDTTGTLLDKNSSVPAANLTGTVADARMPAGSVLQVVQETTTTGVATTSASYQTTGLAAAINVTSGNKVLITGDLNAVGPNGSPETGTTVAIFRGSTQIFQPSEYAGYNTHSTNHTQPIPLDYLDASPGSGDVTYTVKYKKRSGAGTSRAMVDSAMSRIILTEIAG